ncbi:RNA ligase family protein [Hazenella coriacea]|uniref:DNA ligase (ATP) n=1 Tax=Hazenella coriacea TaxID=1179467 RepID=A0A4R3L8W3_9BACL|nr:RNA ligase family protein [Hazenella coriacea]TCS93946.1 bifunctional non-homologous end joining protein LigD [Hazenella coriacea]
MIPLIKPMEPILTNQLIHKKSLLYQVKWDGIRILTNYDSQKTQLYTRKKNERTVTYPEITKELSKMLKEHSVILDGEMIAIDQGKSCFFEILKRDRLKNPQKILQAQSKIPVYYMIFDIIYFNGKWLTDQPLTERLDLLNNLIQETSHVQVCPSYDDGSTLWKVTEEKGWEGIVIKEREGTYHLGQKHTTWLKLKHIQKIHATVIGVTFEQSRSMVNSLILGIFKNGEWIYIGKASTGLSIEQKQLFTRLAQETAQEKGVIPQLRLREPVAWIIPEITVQVQFLEWTPDGTLRSPVIK